MNCDRIAPWYRWLEYASFGRALERTRFRYLDEFNTIHHVLMLGEGDGRFLARFAARYPEAQIDYCDLSGQMLVLARERAPAAKFHQLNVLTDPLPGRSYDLIVTHFFLDCFTDADAASLIAKLAAASGPQACWLVSEFHQPDSGWPAVRAWAWLRLLYTSFRLATGLRTTRLPKYRLLLEQAGFHLQREQFHSSGLLVSELWSRQA